jgi:hypothetical protein
VSLLGQSGVEHVNLLEHMANRAAHHRQLDQALRWIDEAIEIAPGVARGSSMLPSLVQTRARFTASTSSPANPFYAPAPSTAGRESRWFNREPGKPPAQ